VGRLWSGLGMQTVYLHAPEMARVEHAPKKTLRFQGPRTCGQRNNRRIRDEKKEIAQKVTIATVGAAAPFIHGLAIGMSPNYEGFLPGTVDANTGRGVRTDLVVGGLALAGAIAQPKATWSDAALGTGIGLLGAAMGQLGEQYLSPRSNTSRAPDFLRARCPWGPVFATQTNGQTP